MSTSSSGERRNSAIQKYAAQAFAQADPEMVADLAEMTEIGVFHFPLMDDHVIGGAVCWCSPEATFDRMWHDGSIRLTICHHDKPVPAEEQHAG